VTLDRIEAGGNAALRRWQEQVAACRRARGETEEQTWQHAKHWYEDWVRHNDYVDLTLPYLLPLLDSGARVLEIGPGTGAFTLPLARAVREVVAVEPSANMRVLLERNLAHAGAENVHIVPCPIEEAVETLAGPFELAFASYSLYNVEPIDRVLRRLMHLSRHVITLIAVGEGRKWYRDLYHRFRGCDPVPSPRLGHLYPVLLEMGISADVRVFRVSGNYIYDSEAALVEGWRQSLHVDEAGRDTLRDALLPLAEQRGAQIGIYGWSRAALVWIERGRSW
jgi:SAM-dependent methyltransferase